MRILMLEGILADAGGRQPARRLRQAQLTYIAPAERASEDEAAPSGAGAGAAASPSREAACAMSAAPRHADAVAGKRGGGHENEERWL